jgi:hypothetical protein
MTDMSELDERISACIKSGVLDTQAVVMLRGEFHATRAELDRLKDTLASVTVEYEKVYGQLAQLKAGMEGLERYELRAHYWEDVAEYIRADDLNAVLTEEK